MAAMSAAAVLQVIVRILGPALAVLVLLAGAFYAGMRVGGAEQEVETAKQDVRAGQYMLEQYQAWIAENVLFAQKMAVIQQRRAEHNQKTTQELADALAATADLRRDCRFPADSMRLLEDARERAARAAAGGSAAAVP